MKRSKCFYCHHGEYLEVLRKLGYEVKTSSPCRKHRREKKLQKEKLRSLVGLPLWSSEAGKSLTGLAEEEFFYLKPWLRVIKEIFLTPTDQSLLTPQQQWKLYCMADGTGVKSESTLNKERLCWDFHHFAYSTKEAQLRIVCAFENMIPSFLKANV